MKKLYNVKNLNFKKLVYYAEKDVYVGILENDVITPPKASAAKKSTSSSEIKLFFLVHDISFKKPWIGTTIAYKIKSKNISTLFLYQSSAKIKHFRFLISFFDGNYIWRVKQPDSISKSLSLQAKQSEDKLPVLKLKFSGFSYNSKNYLFFIPKRHKLYQETKEAIQEFNLNSQKNQLILSNLEKVYHIYRHDNKDLEKVSFEGQSTRLSLVETSGSSKSGSKKNYKGFEIKYRDGNQEFQTFNQVTFDEQFEKPQFEINKKVIFMSRENQILLFRGQKDYSKSKISPKFLDLQLGDHNTNLLKKARGLFLKEKLNFYCVRDDFRFVSVNLMTQLQSTYFQFKKQVLDFIIFPNLEVVFLLKNKKNKSASPEKISVFRINLHQIETARSTILDTESEDLTRGHTLLLLDGNTEPHDLRVFHRENVAEGENKERSNVYTVMFQQKKQIQESHTNQTVNNSNKDKTEDQSEVNVVSYFEYTTDSSHELIQENDDQKKPNFTQGNSHVKANGVNGHSVQSESLFESGVKRSTDNVHLHTHNGSEILETKPDHYMTAHKNEGNDKMIGNPMGGRRRLLSNARVSDLQLSVDDFYLDFKKSYCIKNKLQVLLKTGEDDSKCRKEFLEARPMTPTILAFGEKVLSPLQKIYFALYEMKFETIQAKYWKIVTKEVSSVPIKKDSSYYYLLNNMKVYYMEPSVPNENKHEDEEYPFTFELILNPDDPELKPFFVFFKNKTLFVFDLKHKKGGLISKETVSEFTAELEGTIVSQVPGEDIQHFFLAKDRSKVYYVDFDKIHFYNLRSRTFEYTLDLGTEMKHAQYNAEKNTMTYYSVEECEHEGRLQQIYHEVDLEHMTHLRKVPICFKDNNNTLHLVLDKDSTSHHLLIQKNNNHLKHLHLSILEPEPSVDFATFPFSDLVGMYSSTNYEPYIKRFSRYYFKELEKFGRRDNHFGPMNPLLACVYHNEHFLLSELLSKYFYPQINEDLYIGPLEFAFRQNYKSCISTICDFAIKHNDNLRISYMDYQSLLRSDLLICHNLLAKIFYSPEPGVIPTFAFQRQPIEIKMAPNIYSLISNDFKNNEEEQLKKRSLEENRDSNENNQVISSKKKQLKNQNSLFSSHDPVQVNKSKEKKAIMAYGLPFKMEFTPGSHDSLMFLDKYSNSVSEDFIFSDWKYLVLKRWSIYKHIHIFIAMLYFLFTILFTVRTVFSSKESLGVRWALAVTIGALLGIELIQIISYCLYDWKLYITSLGNIFDWMVISATIVNLVAFEKNQNETWFKIFTIVMLMIIFYRCFMYFTVFDTFRALIGMINIIIIKLIPFTLVLFFFYAATSLLMMYTDKNNSAKSHFTNTYYWVLFGGIDDGSFEADYSVFAVAFGTLLIGIILLNVLIAYLSNVFSALEEQQTVDSLKGMAGLSLDIELAISLFKKLFSSTYRFKGRYREELYRRMMQNIKLKAGDTKDTPNEDNKLAHAREQERVIWVFKWSDNEYSERDITVEQNIFHKIKESNRKIDRMILDYHQFFEDHRKSRTALELISSQMLDSQSSQKKEVKTLKTMSSKITRKCDKNKTHNEEIKKTLKTLHQQMEANSKKVNSSAQMIKEIYENIGLNKSKNNKTKTRK